MVDDRTRNIFGNDMKTKVVKSAVRKKKKYVKKFGDDSNIRYQLVTERNNSIGDLLGVVNLQIQEGRGEEKQLELETEKGIIVGNIRMGFGHYRISMAIASARLTLILMPL